MFAVWVWTWSRQSVEAGRFAEGNLSVGFVKLPLTTERRFVNFGSSSKFRANARPVCFILRCAGARIRRRAVANERRAGHAAKLNVPVINWRLVGLTAGPLRIPRPTEAGRRPTQH